MLTVKVFRSALEIKPAALGSYCEVVGYISAWTGHNWGSFLCSFQVDFLICLMTYAEGVKACLRHKLLLAFLSNIKIRR